MVRPLTPEDLFSFRFLIDVQLSPDGKRVAYAVKIADQEKDRYRAAIWLIDAEGGEPRQLTSGERMDATPRWSADGRLLAFTSDRGDPPKGREKAPRNLFVLDLAGGEPRLLTRFGDDVSGIAWSPTGDRLCVVAKPPWPEGQEAPKITVYDTLRYKADEGGYFDGRRKHLWLVPLGGGEPEQLTDGDWDDLQPAFSPDGRRIAFVSNRTAERHRNTVTDIWLIDIADRSLERLTASDGPQTDPAFAPDGKSVAYLGHRHGADSYSWNTHLCVHALGGEPRDLCESWEGTAGNHINADTRGLVPAGAPAWSSDGRTLYFTGNERAAGQLFAADVKGGVRPVTQGEHHVVLATLDRGGSRFAALVGTPAHPGDVHVGEVRGGRLRRLTTLNEELLAEAYVATPERVRFGGADGWEIDGWVLKPPDFDPKKKHPLVLEIHGGPHTAYGHSFMHEFNALAGRGYVVLYTNPRGSHTYGEPFMRAVLADWGGKDYEDLMRAVDQLVAKGYVDEARMGVIGGSYGGFMTNWVVGHTTRFAAAVTARCVSNLHSFFGTSDIGWHFTPHQLGAPDPFQDVETFRRFSPLTYVRNVTTPVLVLHSENDVRCPIEQGEQFYAALRFLDKTARMIRYPKDNHDLTRQGTPSNRVHHMRSILEWFDTHLAAERARRRELATAAE